MIRALMAPSRNVFQVARRETSAPQPTGAGLESARKLLAQQGSDRSVVVAGDAAVALKPQTFSEMVAKFGRPKEIERGIYAFSAEGSNLIASWYRTAVDDEGYGAADKDGDGIVTNRESFRVYRMFDFDASGNFFLDTPRPGEVPDDDNVYITLNDAIERDISSDTNKDGTITTSEVKAKEGKDIDASREYYMAMRGQNPDGTFILPTADDLKFDFPELELLKKDITKLRARLEDIDAELAALKESGPQGGEQAARLEAERRTLVAEMNRAGNGPRVDVKA